MKFESEMLDGVRVIRVNGRWTGGPENEQLYRNLRGWLGGGERKFVLELSRTELLTSLGLGAMVSCYSTCIREGANLSLSGLSDRNRRVATVARVLDIYDDYPDLETALRKMG